jgi:preprotein translocase subunit YajC
VIGLFKILSFIISWLLIFALALAVGDIALFAASIVLFAIYCWMVFSGGDKRALKARAKLDGALIKGETVVTTGIQMRVFALFSRRELIAITSSRLVQIKRSILGGFKMKDHQWKDLHDVSLSENTIPGLSGSKLVFTTQTGSHPVVIDGVPSAIATEIYSFSQAKEQEWEEKNRIRELENRRAASGATVVSMGVPDGNKGPGGDDIFERLQKAKALFDSGAISDAEYQELKSKVLSGAPI